MSIPESGSDYTYIRKAFGPALAFLLPWMNVFLPTSDSLTALAFGQYAVQPFFPNSAAPKTAIKLIATCMLLLVAVINAVSVKWAVRVQSVITSAKFLTIAFVVAGGVYFCIHDPSVAETTFANLFSWKQIGGIHFSTISNAVYQVMWTYQGWNALCYVTEEVDHPRTVAVASVIAVVVVAISFITINISYLLVLTPLEMSSSQTVALTFANKLLGNGAWAVSVMVCIVTFGSYNCSVMMSARTLFVAARNGHIPQIFGMLHIHRTTPLTALILNALPTVVLVWIGDIETLLSTFGFVSWTFATFSSASVLVLRIKLPDLPRPYKVPTIIPIFMTAISFFFVVLPLIGNLHFLYLYAVGFFAAGFVVYFIFVRRKARLPGIDPTTSCLQKLFAIAPEDSDHNDS
uniref:B(0,+)-type amino acid transporter 1 n=1 Tax=Phallusia mammillata TaxID=59560 RepID=A0A6F9DTJ9_9ASCI|nr:b(0,+)-type amino acid transporter 1 [Phallusia mammillata]